MPQLEGILIDFYGTIAGGDRAAVVDICRHVVEDHALPIPPEDLAVRWGHAYFEAIEAVDGTFRLLSEIERDTLIETVVTTSGKVIVATPYIARFSDYLARPPLFDEVPQVLSDLDLPLCIVSNADEHELRRAVAHHGLAVQHIVTSESARSYKPDRRIFEAALAATGWSADQVVHIGDSLHSDVGGARKLGIHTIWVNRAERMSDIGTDTPDATWTDLRPLVSLRKI